MKTIVNDQLIIVLGTLESTAILSYCYARP